MSSRYPRRQGVFDPFAVFKRHIDERPITPTNEFDQPVYVDDDGEFAPFLQGISENPLLRFADQQRVQNNLTNQVIGSSNALHRELLGLGAELLQDVSGGAPPSYFTPQPRGMSPTEMGKFESFANGLDQGANMVGVAIAAGAEGVGDFGAMLGSDKLFPALEEAAKNAKNGYLDEIERLALSGTPEDIVAKSLQIIGQTAPLMGLAAVGAAAAGGGALAAGYSRVASQLIGTAAASSVFYPAEKAFLERELLDEGVDAQTAEMWGYIGAIPIAAIEGLMEGFATVRAMAAGKRAVQESGERMGKGTKQIIRDYVKGIAKNSTAEGLTELAQEETAMFFNEFVTGTPIPAEEKSSRRKESFFAGVVAGGAFSTVLGGAEAVAEHAYAQGEATLRKSGLPAGTGLSPEFIERVAASDEAITPEAKDFLEGTVVGDKVKVKGTNNWRTWDTNKPTTAPNTEQILDHIARTTRDGDAEVAAAVQATRNIRSYNLPITEEVARIHVHRPDAEAVPAFVTELNIRKIGVNQALTALDQQRLKNDLKAGEEEIETRIAALEQVAYGEKSAAPYEVRVTALGKARALRNALRHAKATTNLKPDNFDVSIGASGLMAMADEQFGLMKATVDVIGTEVERNMYNLAAAMRANQGAFVESAPGAVVDRFTSTIRNAERAAAKGAQEGHLVSTRDNGVAEVKGITDNGLLVEVDGEMFEVPHEDYTPIPYVNDYVRLENGVVGKVTQASQTGGITVLGPNDQLGIFPIESVTEIVSSSDKIAAIAGEAARVADMVAPQVETVTLPVPVEVVDVNNGQQLSLFEIGDGVAVTDAGETVDLADLAVAPTAPDAHSMDVIPNTGEIPIFSPGTRPAAGRNINFLTISADSEEIVDNLILSGNKLSLMDVIGELEGGPQVTEGFYVLPSTKRGTLENSITYAVELPTEHRSPNKGGRQLLSFIAGKTDKLPVKSDRSVYITHEAGTGFVGVYKVPKNLMLAAKLAGENDSFYQETGDAETDAASREDLRAYLRRLSDLGFEIPNEVADAVATMEEAVEEAVVERVAGNPGVADHKQAEANYARFQALKAAQHEDLKRRMSAFEAVIPDLRATMHPAKLAHFEILQFATEDELQQLKNVGPVVSQRIVESARAGEFVSADDADALTAALTQVKGVSATTAAAIVDKLHTGVFADAHEAAISLQQEALIDFLEAMPPRTDSRQLQSWVPFFEHPDVPGMYVVLDKELVDSFDTGVPLDDDELRQRINVEVLGVEPDAVLTDDNGNTIEPLEMVDREQLEELRGGIRTQQRVIWHLEVIAPNQSQPVRVRSLGHGSATYRVPAHFASRAFDDRGRIRANPVQDELEAALVRGEPVDPILDRLESERREFTYVTLRDRGADEDASTRSFPIANKSVANRLLAGKLNDNDAVFLRNEETGENFEAQVSELEKDGNKIKTRTVKEGNTDISVRYRMNEREQISEVLRELRGFNRSFAGLYTSGEYRSAEFPNTYGDIRQDQDGKWAAQIFWKETESPLLKRMRLFKVVNDHRFDTEAEALAYMEEQGLRPTPTKGKEAKAFANLPLISEVDGTNIGRVHDQLGKILSRYHSNGYIPAPVRDYAVKFAVIASQKDFRVMGGLFNNFPVRKALKIYTTQDILDESQRFVYPDDEHISPVQGYATQMMGATDLYVQDGKLVRERKTPGELLEDVRPFDGILLDSEADREPAQVSEIAGNLVRLSEHRERFYDLIGVDTEFDSADLRKRVGYLESTGETVYILSAPHASTTMQVQTWKDGRPVVMEVPVEDVVRTRSPAVFNDYLQNAKLSYEGFVTQPRTLLIGKAPIDRSLKIGKSSNPAAVASRIRQRAYKLERQLNITPDGDINSPPHIIESLAELWLRMRELGIENNFALTEQLGLTDAAREGMEPYYRSREENRVPGDHVVNMDKVPLIDPRLHNLFREILYPRIAAPFGSHPYGDLMAKVKLGMLTPKLRDQLSKMAVQSGSDPESDLIRHVEYLMENVFDPSLAHAIFLHRRELDLLNFHAGLPTGLKDVTEVRQPKLGGAYQMGALGNKIMLPRTLASLHPTARIFITLQEEARHNHIREMKELDEVLVGASRLSQSQKEVIRDLWESEALGEAMTRPSDILSEKEVLDKVEAPLKKRLFPEWYGWYKTTREFLVRARRNNIRNSLFRGYGLKALDIKFSSNDPDIMEKELEIFARQNKVPMEELNKARQYVEDGGTFYVLDQVSNPANARPDAEINQFLDLLEEYHTWAEVPESVKVNLPNWFAKDFDFYSRYGIKNYAPHIIQGRHAIKRESDGVTVGYTPDGDSAQLLLRKKMEEEPNDNFFIEIGAPIADDIDAKTVGSAAFAQIYQRLVAAHSGPKGDATKMARDVVKAVNLGRERATPKNPHLSPRTANLTSLVEDPFKALSIYWNRTSRNNYLLNVMDAYRVAEAADERASRATGVLPALRHQSRDPGLFTVGQKYMRDYIVQLRDSSMGVEDMGWLTAVMARMPWNWNLKAFAKPKNYQQMLADYANYRKNGGDTALSKWWRNPEFFPMLYDGRFGLQQQAGDANKLQTMIRLGFNIGGSMINSSQSFFLVPGYLMSRGVDEAVAVKAMYNGYMKAWAYAAGAGNIADRTPEWHANKVFLNEVGVDDDSISNTIVPGIASTKIFGRSPVFTDDKALKIEVPGTDVILTPKHMRELMQVVAMAPFGMAENLTRRAAAFAAMEASESLGLTEAQRNAFARSVVNETQFQYHDAALPPYMRGPASRVLFQFMHYQMNAIKYEKDVFKKFFVDTIGHKMVRAIDRDAAGSPYDIIRPDGQVVPMDRFATSSFMWHMGAIGMMGGLAGIASRPAFAALQVAAQAIGSLAGVFGDDKDIEGRADYWMSRKWGAAVDRSARRSDYNVADPELLYARNILLYGLPGALSLNISNRIAVSGLDYSSLKLSDAFGPTGAFWGSIYKGLYAQGGFTTANPQATGLGIAMTPLVRAGVQKVGGRFPGATAGALLASTAMSSELIGDMTFGQYLNGTAAGKGMFNDISPAAVEGIFFTHDVFNNSEVYDQNNNTRNYGSGFNKAFASAAKLIGYQTVSDFEERALVSYINNKIDAMAARRGLFMEAVTTNLLTGSGGLTSGDVAELIRAAESEGIFITNEDILRAIRGRNRGSVERALDRARLDQRRLITHPEGGS